MLLKKFDFAIRNLGKCIILSIKYGMTRLPCNQSFLLLFKKTASCKTETRVSECH